MGKAEHEPDSIEELKSIRGWLCSVGFALYYIVSIFFQDSISRARYRASESQGWTHVEKTQ